MTDLSRTTFSHSFQYKQNYRLRSRSTHYTTIDHIGQRHQSMINTSLNQIHQSEHIESQSKHVTFTSSAGFNRNTIEQLVEGRIDDFMKKIKIEISSAIDKDDIFRLGHLLELIAEVMLSIRELDKAMYYFNQAVLISSIQRMLYTYTSNFERKAIALIGLAQCCQQITEYKQAIQFLRKALQYAWFCKNKSTEITIYEHMAMYYYYLADQEQAKYFHERGTLGILELETSPIKQFSNQQIHEYLKKIQFTFSSITQLFLSYFTIPFLNYEQYPSDNKSNLRVTCREIFIPRAQDLANHLLIKEEEFKNYINTPKYQKLELNNYFIHSKFQDEEYKRKRTRPVKRTYNIKDSSIYKLPLNTQIAERINNPYKQIDLAQKMKSIAFRCGTKQDDNNEIRPAIFINHLTKEGQFYRKNIGVLYNKIHRIFQQHLNI